MSKSTQWVLVDTIVQFHSQCLVEVPEGKADWALDTVSCNEAKEFSQRHLGDTIVSHRVISMEEALQLCDQYNDYAKDWPDEVKVDAFFTEWKEQDDN